MAFQCNLNFPGRTAVIFGWNTWSNLGYFGILWQNRICDHWLTLPSQLTIDVNSTDFHSLSSIFFERSFKIDFFSFFNFWLFIMVQCCQLCLMRFRQGTEFFSPKSPTLKNARFLTFVTSKIAQNRRFFQKIFKFRQKLPIFLWRFFKIKFRWRFLQKSSSQPKAKNRGFGEKSPELATLSW